jgi:hypothetical protein
MAMRVKGGDETSLKTSSAVEALEKRGKTGAYDMFV